MIPDFKNRSGSSFMQMTPPEIAVVLRHSALLRQAAAQSHRPLKGKNLGLLCEAADDPGALRFRRAAEELGAHVTHIRPSLCKWDTPAEVQHTSRMLGRLYQAIECQGMPAALTRQIHDLAGVPVYDGIATDDHPTSRLAEELADDASLEDRRRFVLQSLLLNTMAQS